MIRVVHPGSRIPDPDADFLPSRIPDPGVKKAPNPGSRIRIRNTAVKLLNLSFNADPDPAFYSNVDPDPGPASKANADPDPQPWLN
jgi:hypothetical protein